MIKFFRRIRRKLLDEGNLKRYLVYAIGEILLVVIGILLALQINAWNQSEKDKDEEKEYLERIVTDLKEDLLELDETIKNNESIIWTAAQVIEKVEGLNVKESIWWTEVYDQIEHKYKIQPKIDLNRFGPLLYYLQTMREFKSTKIAFQELVSTGKLNLIRDKELKQSIQFHYVLIEERSGFQEIVLNADDQYGASLVKIGLGSLNQKSFSEIKDKLHKDSDLIATLKNYFNYSGICIYILYYESGSIKESTDNLIEEIENYLN